MDEVAKLLIFNEFLLANKCYQKSKGALFYNVLNLPSQAFVKQAVNKAAFRRQPECRGRAAALTPATGPIHRRDNTPHAPRNAPHPSPRRLPPAHRPARAQRQAFFGPGRLHGAGEHLDLSRRRGDG